MPKPLPRSLDLAPLITQKATRQRCHLLRLPPKLVKRIFKKIKHPRDQVAFMLSCKKTAKLTSKIKLRSAIITTTRVGQKTRKLYTHRQLVEALKRWKWIPGGLQFCHACEKYLPRNRLWIARNGKPITKLRHVDWMWAVGQWTRGGKLCPTCQIRDVEEGKDWLQAWPEGGARGPLIKQELGQ
ncbi:hypothetical protein OHC33_009724 [Knufia fluminis]|uniref:F-box domain-containing protein n=1 Tax=Knufia fluminis TaxID=191047 RepID=A0AAN8EPA3_9EURO|nr:hypothetical protein OHC33_009724 [Knufia fluminis]